MEKILIIDDEKDVVDLLQEYLMQVGYDTATAYSLHEGEQQLANFQPGFVLLDIKLPDGDGIQFLKKIKAAYPETEVIMITGLADRVIALEALKLGAADYICKPIDLEYLSNSVLAKIVTRYDQRT